MNTNLQIFEFESQTIRTVEMNGEVWFVAKDVADLLGYERANNAIQRHCKNALALNDLKRQHTGTVCCNEINELHPRALLIQEPDVFRLIMNSQLKSAERFEKWVMEEVLPTIRKTGQYQMPTLKTPITAGQMFMEVAKQFLVFEEKLFALESSHKKLEDRVDEITPTKGYLTITAFLKKYHIQMEFKDRQALGLHATQVCRERNLFIDKIPDARYGSVGAYPEEVLVELLEIEI